MAGSEYVEVTERETEEAPEPKAEPKGDNSEGVRALREQLKAERERREALEVAAAEQVRAEREQRLTNVFERLGLDPKAASLYGEGEVTEESVASWAEAHGISRPPAVSVEGESKFDVYNRLIAAGISEPIRSIDDELEDIQTENLKLLGKSLGEKGGLNPFVPTPAEVEANRALTRRVNLANKRQARMIDTGRATANTQGFGGAVSPPEYSKTYLRND